MAEWPNRFRSVIHRIERRIDAARGPRTATGEIEIILFRSYGTSGRLDVIGRVVRRRAIVEAAGAGTPWKNLVETWRRAASEEIPGVRVVVRFGFQSVEVTTDDEGYLHAAIEFPAMPGISGWQQITAELTGGNSPASGHVLVPPPTAAVGIVSDIDDTIVETNAVSLMRMARTVLLRNARGRVAVPGIAAAFDALVGGASGAAGNPMFYVSSSPWNLYDLLTRFLDLNKIPVGPLMLQDYGIDDTKLINRAHDDHKLEQIAEIVNRYPALPFVLVGDSGQRDPEIYREVALAFPGRIRAVFIRDVTSAERDLAVKGIAEELTRLGVATFPFEDAADIVKESRTLGLVAENKLAAAYSRGSVGNLP